MTESQAHLLIVYIGIVSVSLLIMAIAVGAIGFAVAKLVKQLADLTAEAKGKVYPILASVQTITDHAADISGHANDMMADAKPKLRRVTANIADTSDVYRAKVAQVDTLVTDTVQKTKRQSDRVDGMITHALTRTGEIAGHVEDALLAPVRHASGFVSMIKGTIEGFMAPKAKPTPKPVAFEGESSYTGLVDDYHA